MTETAEKTDLVPSTDPLPARDVWEQKMDRATEESGYFHSLGDAHWAYFADEGTTLLVSFETIDEVLARPDQMPLADSLARGHGWSVLTIIADGATWFRDSAVYAFFDRQVDDAFFEDFDQVLFYGAGMSGYAACAYAVTAPGAQVLALNPRATLEPAQSRWDKRDLAARKFDFTSRYGYAPDMLEGAGQAVVIHDPTIPVEAMHASLFRAPYITRLSARHMGDTLEPALIGSGILPALVDQAMAGSLTEHSFAALWRARRNYSPYLRAILAKAEGAGRTRQAMMICRSVTERLHAPSFARRLAKLTDRMTSAEA
ncbi:MAG: phosphoadenosine phosphosulfate reductase [Cypionkella sp.]|uniref:phosphoadenosine phosphosulfate reductase n=1 Tax=Cypionkella sp. TaxID=2811411 RepID=UPI002AB8D9C1|nr:phosphoadenosine phosphosulfate reductase [Cypionkella sp.]MDZ4309172.1 phosphoadenosine phosphosulfate reductase [Cypionkella sp.]